MPSVAIISKPQKPELKEILPELLGWLEQRGWSAVLDPESARYVPQSAAMPVVERADICQRGPEFVIVLGGDGTLLAAARCVAKVGIPLLAVNLGSLGFLTETTFDELYHTLEAAIAGSCAVDKRAMLLCRLMRQGNVIVEQSALNDVALTKAAIARMIEFDVMVDGSLVSHYKADGLIVSTPTGSTAYSLAAGGPVLVPTVRAFVVTPISPHALTNRPLVVQDTSEVRIGISLHYEDAHLTIDGQLGIPMINGDQVTCCRSPHEVKLLRLGNGNKFFEVLRRKLHWGER
jgi:NAD+ kinase